MLMAIGSLLAILRLLFGGATAMSPRNILLFLGFGLHFAGVGVLMFPTAAKVYTVFQNQLEIILSTHSSFHL